MTSQPLRVGIVGLQPGRSWAARAHVPALRALSADFVIAGIANTTLASAVQAAAAMDHGPRPFASVADLVASPDIDVIRIPCLNRESDKSTDSRYASRIEFVVSRLDDWRTARLLLLASTFRA